MPGGIGGRPCDGTNGGESFCGALGGNINPDGLFGEAGGAGWIEAGGAGWAPASLNGLKGIFPGFITAFGNGLTGLRWWP